MKKILLLGADGQVGQELAREGAAHGFEVHGFGHAEADITDIAAVRAAASIKPDVLINAAAYHVLPECEQNPTEALRINMEGAAHVARIARELSVPVVFYSTDYVFDGAKGAPYEEGDAVRPLQVYGFSKLAGEYAVQSAHPVGALVVRAAGIFGGETGSRSKGGNFVLTVLKTLQEKRRMEVSSDIVISPTYAGDLARATLELLRAGAPAGVYHLSNAGEASWYEFAKEIQLLTGAEGVIEGIAHGGQYGGMRRPLYSALANTAAKKYGVELPHWREGIKSYVQMLHL